MPQKIALELNYTKVIYYYRAYINIFILVQLRRFWGIVQTPSNRLVQGCMAFFCGHRMFECCITQPMTNPIHGLCIIFDHSKITGSARHLLFAPASPSRTRFGFFSIFNPAWPSRRVVHQPLVASRRVLALFRFQVAILSSFNNLTTTL